MSSLATNRLYAILAPTNNTARVTNLQDRRRLHRFRGLVEPARAVSGYPNITVPAGYVRGHLPLGVSFFGGRRREPT
jgi:amidase